MTLLAIDPGRSYKGDETIGYCLFDNVGAEIERGQLSWETLIVRFDADGVDLWFTGADGTIFLINEVVIEDFINDPKSARGGQRNGTSECIGGVEMACGLTRTPMTRQEPRILGPAKLHANYTQTLKHLPHQDSAYLHGYYYLVGKGVLQSKGLEGTIGDRTKNDCTCTDTTPLKVYPGEDSRNHGMRCPVVNMGEL